MIDAFSEDLGHLVRSFVWVTGGNELKLLTKIFMRWLYICLTADVSCHAAQDISGTYFGHLSCSILKMEMVFRIHSFFQRCTAHV